MLEEVLQYGGLYCTLTSREASTILSAVASAPQIRLSLRSTVGVLMLSLLFFVSFQGASGAGSLGSTNAWAEALELWLCLCRVFHEQDDLSSQIIRHGKSGRDCRSFAQAPKKLSERVLEILNRSSGHGQGLLGLRKPSLKRNKVHRALRFFGFPTNGLWW